MAHSNYQDIGNQITIDTLQEMAQSLCSQHGIELPAENGSKELQVYQALMRLDSHAAHIGQEMWHYKVKWQGAERMIETFKSTVATLEKRLDKVCDSVRLICDRIVESNVTHGQKNGMIILLSSLVTNWRRSVNIEDHDIPF